jgi:hypothetical protein
VHTIAGIFGMSGGLLLKFELQGIPPAQETVK